MPRSEVGIHASTPRVHPERPCYLTDPNNRCRCAGPSNITSIGQKSQAAIGWPARRRPRRPSVPTEAARAPARWRREAAADGDAVGEMAAAVTSLVVFRSPSPLGPPPGYLSQAVEYHYVDAIALASGPLDGAIRSVANTWPAPWPALWLTARPIERLATGATVRPPPATALLLVSDCATPWAGEVVAAARQRPRAKAMEVVDRRMEGLRWDRRGLSRAFEARVRPEDRCRQGGKNPALRTRPSRASAERARS
jgi:hypothetical protein